MDSLKIVGIDIPKVISFWNFEKGSKCNFSLLSKNLRLNLSLEKENYSRSQIYGLLYHYLEEKFHNKEFILSDYDSFLVVLEEFENKYQDRFNFKSYRKLDEWSEVVKIYDYFLEKTFYKKEVRSELGETHFEKTIFHTELGIMGNIDLVYEYENDLEIWEFKSGKIHNSNGQLNLSYVRQLHFYLILAEEFFKKKVRRLFLNSPISGKIEVIISTDLIYSIKNEIIELKNKIQKLDTKNIKMINKELAEPKLDSCKFCEIKHLCDEFEGFVNEYSGDDNIFSVTGELENKGGKVKVLNSIVVNSKGKESHVTINNIPQYIIENIRDDRLYSFLDLKKTGEKDYSFTLFSKVLIFYET